MEIVSLVSGYSLCIVIFIVAPVCKSREPKTYGISVTETVNATCEVEADPLDVSYRWSLDSPLGTLALSNWSNAHHRGFLSYSPLSGSGYGTLLCWSRNSVGAQKEPCLVQVVPAGPQIFCHGESVNLSTSSPTEEQQNSTCFTFIMKAIDIFTVVSPLLIEKAIASNVRTVMNIRKIRSKDMFLEESLKEQDSVLVNLHLGALFEVTVISHTILNYS
ncbi:uncharacterized protein NPIL_438211 [Nephila pilipes]|uniref:Ig-like domain-containing protein n=1 Tax=Nephila pilipes TaxID=299642 RepID=A0A8X6Q496_NEPPI|nr:uncharacterized protein NPIL_438211 [Nephila pilipes]